MTAARQASPAVAPGRRRQDRALPEVEPTQREPLRFAVRHNCHGWMHEYRDGAPTWGGPQEAALFTDERAACSVAHELGGQVVTVLCKHLEGDA